MKRDMPELEAAKEQKICFVDDFALGGDKYRGVSVALRLLGFTKMHFAFFAAKEDTELDRDVVVGERSVELVAHLRHMGEHIQGKEDAAEMLDDVKQEAHRLRAETLGELKAVGRHLKGRGR